MFQPRGLRILHLFALAVLVCPALQPSQSPQTVTVGNKSLERVFEIRDGRLRTVALRNRLDHRTYAVDSEEFRLTFTWERLHYEHGYESPVSLTASDFAVQGFERTPAGGGGEKVVFRLLNRKFELEVDLVCTAGAGDSFSRKWLEIRSAPGAPVFLDRIAVENFSFRGVAPRFGGFGQPVYLDNVFTGLEYPAGYNNAEKTGSVALSYYAGETTGSGALRTESAVLGVAPEGATRTAFLDYIDAIRAAPVRPVTVFNTWYDMQRDTLTSRNSLQRFALLKTNLLDPFGLPLTSFVLDDGWENRNTVWEVHRERFPNGFAELNAELRRHGSALGLWFGPAGGYEERPLRIAAARAQGYEITGAGEYLCLAGPRYLEKFKSTVLKLVDKYSVNHLKLDGIPYGCNAPGHGHLPGIHSRDAHVRAFIDVLRTVRAAAPGVFLNITTGNWLSPWWLQYADVVFMGGHDYGFLNTIPSVTERDKAITYRDKVLFDDYRRFEYQFPNSSLMTIGIIKGLLGAEGGLKERLENWTHNAIMNFARGTMLTELYVSPEILTAQEWTNLGRIMRWADRNRGVLLKDTRFILGDPGRGEVYGYSHFAADRGIVTLRNPTIENRRPTITLDGALGIGAAERKWRAKVVYPYLEVLAGAVESGGSLTLPLQGFEVLVLEFVPADSLTEPVPAGIRYEVAAAGATSTTYNAFAPPGASIEAAILGSGVTAVELDGNPLAPGARIEFPAAGAADDFHYELRPKGDASQFLAALDLTVPAAAEGARLAILCEQPGSGTRVSAKLRNNGHEVPLEAVSPSSSEEGLGYGEGGWAFFVAPVQAGENRIELEVSRPEGSPAAGAVSAWVLGESVLPKRQLRIVHSPVSGQRPAADETLPASSGREKKVVHLFTQRW